MKISSNLIMEYFQRIPIILKRSKINHSLQYKKRFYGEQSSQHYLLSVPLHCNPQNILFFIHSGSWTFGTPNGFRFVAKALNHLGYGVVLAGYRRMPQVKYTEIIKDIYMCFIHAKKELRPRFPDAKFTVIGASAGAHLGSLLVYNSHLQNLHGVNSDDFLGFCSIAGPLAFDNSMPKFLKKLLHHLFVEKYHFLLGNPIVHANRTNTKVLCIHSTLDPLCPISQSKRFVDKLNSLKKDTASLFSVSDKSLLHSSLINRTFLEPSLASFQALKSFLTSL